MATAPPPPVSTSSLSGQPPIDVATQSCDLLGRAEKADRSVRITEWVAAGIIVVLAGGLGTAVVVFMNHPEQDELLAGLGAAVAAGIWFASAAASHRNARRDALAKIRTLSRQAPLSPDGQLKLIEADELLRQHF